MSVELLLNKLPRRYYRNRLNSLIFRETLKKTHNLAGNAKEHKQKLPKEN